MCAMAAVWAGVSKIYFGATIDDAAAHGHQVKIYCREVAEKAWYDIKVEGGVLQEDCVALFHK
jgi:tRNA(Arg) A34 adenosine deaminase TadA